METLPKPPRMYRGKCEECLWEWLAPKGTGCPNEDCKFYNTRKAAVSLGKRGGSTLSEKKAKAARENGKKGGRPKKLKTTTK